MPEAHNTQTRRRRASWPILTYVIVLALCVLVAQALSTVYERRAATDDVRAAAIHDSAHIADLAAALIRADIDAARAIVADRAATPALLDAARRGEGCGSAFRPEDAFTTNHVDFIGADGVTLCTSAGSTVGTAAGAVVTAADRILWLDPVLAGPAVVGLVNDPSTGRASFVVGAPFAGASGAPAAVVEFVDLAAFGSALATRLGRADEFELLVTTQADTQVLTRSVEPDRWIGVAVADTPFGRAAQQADRPDLDGTRRLYAAAPVSGTGWTVYAGADRAVALRIAVRTTNRSLLVSCVLLVLALIAATVMFQRIGRPISNLGVLVRSAIASGTFRRADVSGPREVEELANDFADLIADRETELRTVRRLAATNSAILASAIDSIITIDCDGRIVEFNPAAERTFGYARSEVVGRQLADVAMPERSREGHRHGLAHYFATGEGPIFNQRVELTAMRKDGTEFPVELTVTLVDVPGSPLFTGYVRDLTAQARARDELAASEARMQQILDNSPALIYMKDLEGRYLFINHHGLQAVGLDREEIIGRTDGELFPADVAEAYRASDLAALGQLAPVQTELIGPDGTRTYLSVKFALLDADGVAYGTAGISTDITERKRIEVERQFLQERLDQSQRLESLGRLAGGVAHDFNNLLAVILIHAKFVADATTGQVRDDVEQISIAAERAAGLTRQLLVFGRRETVHPQVLDLYELVMGVRDVIARGIGAQIELVVEAEPHVPRVLADRGQLEQVLLNLAINARDAMPDGGTLAMRIGTAVEPAADGAVCLTVTDSGSGITAEVAARAFEPFFTTKPPGEGTGLGLATAYGIITAAGGTIALSATPDGGTTVRIVLPAAVEPAPSSPELVVASSPRGHGETILVVDDEPALLAVTVRMLEDNGYDVIGAGSGDEALVRAEGEDIHLLLTDFVMPKMSGSQLAERMCAERPHMAVLLMSGYSQGLSNHQRLDDDAVRQLRKPFTEHELLTIVDEVIAGSARSRAGSAG